MRTLFLILFILIFTIIATAQTKSEIIHKITTEANRVGLDPDIAVAIATVESSLNPKAVGSLNEQGLFQLRPEFHALNGEINNNVQTGVKYLVQIRNKNKGRYGNAWFVLFNYGPHKQVNEPTKTKYYLKVMREISKIKTNRFLAKN
jgi:soluble lytic murein transglycosylase-like protein